jgi:hypothetical protein
MAETETTETEPKAHETAEPSSMEGTEQKSPKAIAEDYMIPMSDAALHEWKGKEGFTEYAAQMASGLFPTLATQLAMGITTKALLDPYIQIAMQTVGDNIKPNWNDPKWAKALSGGTDPKTGHPTVMPLADWVTYLKTSPDMGYENHPDSHSAVDSALQQMQNPTDAWDGTPEGAAAMSGGAPQEGM